MTNNQNKAMEALEGAVNHAKKVGNPEMAWIAAGACGLPGIVFLSLVAKGLAEKRPARGDCLRKYDYRAVDK